MGLFATFHIGHRPSMHRLLSWALLTAVAMASATTTPLLAKPILLVSIDGLRPGDVVDANARGIRIPFLSALLASGTHAEGVIGVLPTLTLPSHATLITGVSPARHGITNNVAFRPQGPVPLDASTKIQARTLWEAAREKGLVTASVNWPVSETASGIDHNVVSAGEQGSDEQYLLAAQKLAHDFKPDLLTVHFGSLDGAEHRFGPGSAEARAALEKIDGYVGKLIETVRAVQPDTIVTIVSDHGFTATKKEINLLHAFVEAGLVRIDSVGNLISWEAAPWPAGGTGAIVLARPGDAALKARVSALLARLKADPATGIEAIYDADELKRRGGFPGAGFGIAYRLDTTGPSAPRPISQALIAPAVQSGTHGHDPAHTELQATLIIAGPNITVGRNLGVVDQRAVAPTLARLLGVALPDAERPPLSIEVR